MRRRIIIIVLLFLSGSLSGTKLHAETSTPSDTSGTGSPENSAVKFDSLLNTGLVMSDPPLHSIYPDSLEFKNSGKTRSNTTGGFRLFMNWYTHELTYIEEHLEQYGVSDIGSDYGINLSIYSTRSHYYLEVEMGVDFGDSRLNLSDGELRGLKIDSFSSGLWFRRGFHNIFKTIWKHAPRIDILPGVSIAYVSTSIKMTVEKDDHVYEEQVLAGTGWSCSAGVIARYFIFFIEYRYRWRNLSDVWTSNGGEFFFSGDPELDFSGHFIGFGFGGDGNMYAND